MIVKELVTLLGFKLNEEPVNRFKKQIGAAKEKSDGLAESARRVKTAWKIGAAAAAVGAGWISRNIVRGTLEYEAYRQQLQAFTGDAASAAAKLEELRGKKADALFGSGPLVDSFKQLRTVGMEAGRVSRMIDVLGDIANGSAANFSALNNTLVRAAAEGKVNERTMRALAMAGFGAQDMADGLGVSVERLNADIAAGRVGFDELTRAMERSTMAGGRFYGNAASQALTLGGSIRILRGTISDFSDAIGLIMSETAGEAGGARDANRKFGAAVIEYIARNMEVTYGWAAFNPATGAADPQISFAASLSAAGGGDLAPQGSFDAFLEGLAALIRARVTLSPPAGFALAPLSFNPQGRLAVKMNGEATREAAMRGLCAQIIAGLASDFPSGQAVSGSRGAFAGNTTRMGIA